MTEQIQKLQERKKVFSYKGKKYLIDSSSRIDGVGDFYENGKLIYVDKDVPEKFHNGIAVHEIEERIFLKQGFSYGWSHNQAQKKELEYYIKEFGEEEAKKLIHEEDILVNETVIKICKEDLKKLKGQDFVAYNVGHVEN